MRQLVAMLVCCALSAGCVAEEVKQPAVAELASDNNEVVITTHIDPETGKEYQELKSIFIIKKINYYPMDSNIHIVGVNNVAIRYPTGGYFPQGKFTWPNNIKYEQWEQLIGRKAVLHCRLTNAFISDKKFCDHGCSLNGERSFSFDRFCTLSGNQKYHLIVE